MKESSTNLGIYVNYSRNAVKGRWKDVKESKRILDVVGSVVEGHRQTQWEIPIKGYDVGSVVNVKLHETIQNE